MNLFNALILGIIEGVTEFLPISSTAHLIITSKLLHLTQTEFLKFFEVFIQSGAILAVIFMYFQYVFKHKEVIKKILISFVPTAVIGFLLHKIIKTIFFDSYYLIIGAMFIIGVVFLLIEYLIKKKIILVNKPMKNITYGQALLIGFGQSLAVIPGVSRAGIVMVVMMIQGFKRDEAAIYSFLLAVPTILAASAFDLLKMNFNIINNSGNLVFLGLGFITSFITAYISIKWLISFLQKKSLVIFGLYRVLTSLLLFMV